MAVVRHPPPPYMVLLRRSMSILLAGVGSCMKINNNQRLFGGIFVLFFILVFSSMFLVNDYTMSHEHISFINVLDPLLLFLLYRRCCYK